MNRAQKIAAVVSGLVVVGLIALAAPTVAQATGALSRWALFQPTPEPIPTAAAAGSVDVADAADADGDGYICVGDTCFPADGPGDCVSNAAIHPYGAYDPRAQLGGELVDMGASEYASGAVGYNADGLIETYTVEPGDSLIAIGERFCVDYVTVGAYNDRFGDKTIQPGDVLVLRP